MRKIIIVFLFVAIAQTGFSQALDLNPKTLDNYVGTWKYENAATNEIFIVKLKKAIRPERPMLPAKGCIVGTYSYTKNGVVVVDNMDKFNMEWIDIYAWPIYASYSDGDEDDMIMLYMCFTDDIIGKESFGCSLRALNSRKGPQIRWVLAEAEGLYTEDMNIRLGFSVPTDVILNKVE